MAVNISFFLFWLLREWGAYLLILSTIAAALLLSQSPLAAYFQNVEIQISDQESDGATGTCQARR